MKARIAAETRVQCQVEQIIAGAIGLEEALEPDPVAPVEKAQARILSQEPAEIRCADARGRRQLGQRHGGAIFAHEQ